MRFTRRRPWGNGFRAENPKHALAADFTLGGDEKFHTMRCGGGSARAAMAMARPWAEGHPVAPQATANRVEYRRGALTEWYVNGPLGLEQGLTLERAPGEGAEGGAIDLCAYPLRATDRLAGSRGGGGTD